MKIIVCIRQGLDGELGPFDSSAYEAALRIPGAEVTLLSMGPESAGDFLLSLTRLGAKKAILLSEGSFAGADTLATAYTLSLAIKKLSPDLVFAGRQTLIGDTGQTPIMLSELLGYSLINEAMKINSTVDGFVSAETRTEGEMSVSLPALITLERSYELRFPGLRSRAGEVVIWRASDIGAEPSRTGLVGSPTRVIKTFENQSGKRKCTFISRNELDSVIKAALNNRKTVTATETLTEAERLPRIMCVNGAPEGLASAVAEKILRVEAMNADELIAAIKNNDPDAVIFGSNAPSKRLSATVSARLGLGLCADCTRFEAANGELIMYRPALSGSIIAKIKSLTRPAMATVRGEGDSADEVIFGVGFGVKDKIDEVRKLADLYGASLAASRRLVDNGYMPYASQVGLTGKTVSPSVYVAVGISGAVHHIPGMERSGTVVAINPDRNAPIFEYADFGIIDEF